MRQRYFRTASPPRSPSCRRSTPRRNTTRITSPVIRGSHTSSSMICRRWRICVPNSGRCTRSSEAPRFDTKRMSAQQFSRVAAMRIAVMGTGGVGGYFGARLARGGSDVHFIARGRHLAAMREHGLRVKSSLGDIHITAPRTTDQPASIGPVDLVLFAVKLWDTEAAAKAIMPLLGPNTAVISFQNGVQKDDV